MKIYATTNTNSILDKYLGKDIWVKCDVSRVMFLPLFTASSWAQDHPCWVRVVGKATASGEMIGTTSIWYADEIRQRTAENGDMYFINFAECDWDKDSGRPVSILTLNTADSHKKGVCMAYAKDIKLITPVDMMSTDEVFDPSWLEVSAPDFDAAWEDEWGI